MLNRCLLLKQDYNQKYENKRNIIEFQFVDFKRNFTCDHWKITIENYD